jgi:hypothetical protein
VSARNPGSSALSIQGCVLRLLGEECQTDPMTIMSRLATIIACIRSAAPYLAIELILPGGSLIALCLWLLKQRARRRGGLAISR